MPDRPGHVTALVETDAEPAEVSFDLDPRASLPDILHAVLCASPGVRPGRTLRRHVEFGEG